MLTVSVENYLKAIFHLEQDSSERVRTKALAEELSVSLPSATNMLKWLADSELIDYLPYNGARLTIKGRKQAIRVVRNHRLVEAFLVETLNYGWDEVHAEAERLEHVISDDLAERIDIFLGRPEFDPHGDPIPRADGAMARRSTCTLLVAPAHSTLMVTRVLDQQAEVLRYLRELGIVPGASIEVVELQPFEGPVVFRNRDGVAKTISRMLAARVMVRFDDHEQS